MPLDVKERVAAHGSEPRACLLAERIHLSHGMHFSLQKQPRDKPRRNRHRAIATRRGRGCGPTARANESCCNKRPEEPFERPRKFRWPLLTSGRARCCQTRFHGQSEKSELRKWKALAR